MIFLFKFIRLKLKWTEMQMQFGCRGFYSIVVAAIYDKILRWIFDLAHLKVVDISILTDFTYLRNVGACTLRDENFISIRLSSNYIELLFILT